MQLIKISFAVQLLPMPTDSVKLKGKDFHAKRDIVLGLYFPGPNTRWMMQITACQQSHFPYNFLASNFKNSGCCSRNKKNSF